MKLDQDPRLTQGPGFFPALIEWMRRAARGVNPLIDAIGPIRGNAKSISETLDGPAFGAHLAANAAGVTGGWTSITTLTEQFDTNSCFDPSNGRFTPNVPGWYHASAAIYVFGNGGSLNYAEFGIYKSGSLARRLSIDANGLVETYVQRSGGGLIFLNGTTDYLHLAYNCTLTAGTLSIAGDAAGSATFITAHLARRA